jgi:hypothetical protein
MAVALEQPRVFEPRHRLANTELDHDEAPEEFTNISRTCAKSAISVHWMPQRHDVLGNPMFDRNSRQPEQQPLHRQIHDPRVAPMLPAG